jgi:hypothetical protein
MSKLSRMILLTFVVLALAAVAPASAGQAPAPQAPAFQAQTGATLDSTPGCAPSLDALFAPSEPAQSKASASVGAPVQPEWMASKLRGHCRCGCSFTPDCNTSADCGGSPCLGSVTCC